MMLRETHTAEGQRLEEQGNMLKLQMFGIGTQKPTISITDGQFFFSLAVQPP
jgi:hypothetical protein